MNGLLLAKQGAGSHSQWALVREASQQRQSLAVSTCERGEVTLGGGGGGGGGGDGGVEALKHII